MNGWLSSDINDLLELVTEYCSEHECYECPFNKGRNVNCLKDISNSLDRDMDILRIHSRRLEQYV